MHEEQTHFPLPGLIQRVIIGDRILGRDPSKHHMQKVNGVWCVRVTIDKGPKFCGERVKKSLGTGDLTVAKFNRDLFIAGIKAAGARIVKSNGVMD